MGGRRRVVPGGRGARSPTRLDPGTVARVSLLKPPRLRPGDTIAVVCPAGPVVPIERIAAGVSRLESRGYRVKVGRNVAGRHGHLAGTDAARLDDLNGFLRDPDVRMILAARGGYGTPRLLEGVDYAAVRRDPKWVAGYSDITALQMALLAKTGLVTVSGPMAAVEFAAGPDPFTEDHFWRLVTGDPSAWEIRNPPGRPTVALRSGSAEGVLLGGCLSLVAALVGTPYLPDTGDALLVLEDIHEHWHRVDRMLMQLRLAGRLGGLAGLVLGQFTNCRAAEPGDPGLGLAEIAGEVAAGTAFPIVAGFDYGHEARKVSLPWGVRARLDADDGSLRLLESPVA